MLNCLVRNCLFHFAMSSRFIVLKWQDFFLFKDLTALYCEHTQEIERENCTFICCWTLGDSVPWQFWILVSKPASTYTALSPVQQPTLRCPHTKLLCMGWECNSGLYRLHHLPTPKPTRKHFQGSMHHDLFTWFLMAHVSQSPLVTALFHSTNYDTTLSLFMFSYRK